MPGLVKIGCTTRRVEERVEELNGASGVPAPFTMEAYFGSSTPEEHEAEIHKRLGAQRVKGREFFEAGITTVVRAVQEVVGARPTYLRGASVNLGPEPPGVFADAGTRWSCGLCKHEWTVSQRSALSQCPLCQSSSIVCLSR